MKYKRHKQPSDKQLKVIALLEANPQMTPTEAGRLAGYSENTVKNMGKNVMQRPIVKTILDNYRYELNQHNINPKRLAKVLDEGLDSTKPIINKIGMIIAEVPDRKERRETVKLIHDIWGISAKEAGEDGKLKRKLTIEEYEEKEGI